MSALLEIAENAWVEHTGQIAPSWRLYNSTISQLEDLYPGQKELNEFVRDSIAAWVWSHSKEETLPIINLNTSLISESNTRRLEAYRAKAGNYLNRVIQTADEVLLAEQEWFQWLMAGELPDFECFKPCAAWIMASMLWKRPIDHLSKLSGCRDETNRPLGKTLQELIQKTSSKSGCEVFLRTVQGPLDEALRIHLCSSGWMAVGSVDGIPFRRFIKEGAEALFETHSLRKRDRIMARLGDITLVRGWEHDEVEDSVHEPEKSDKKKFTPLAQHSLLDAAIKHQDE